MCARARGIATARAGTRIRGTYPRLAFNYGAGSSVGAGELLRERRQDTFRWQSQVVRRSDLREPGEDAAAI